MPNISIYEKQNLTPRFSLYYPEEVERVARIQNLIPTETIGLDGLKDILVNDTTLQDQTIEVRSCMNEDEQKKLKSNLPYITPQGVFEKRERAGIVEASGLFFVDTDHLTDKEKEEIYKGENETAYFITESVRGEGLHIFYRIALPEIDLLTDEGKEKFKRLYEEKYFNAFTYYYFTKYNVQIDPKCFNYSQPCFINYAPACSFNENPIALGQEFIKKNKMPEIEQSKQENKIVCNDSKKIIAFCEKVLQERNLESFHEGNRQNYIFKACCVTNRYGISKGEAASHFMQYKQPGFGEAEIKSAVVSAYRNTQEHGTRQFFEYSTRPLTQTTQPQKNNEPTKELAEFNPLAIREELRLNDEKDSKELDIMFYINGVPGGTKGNFGTLIGKGKAGKTKILNAIMAAMFSSYPILNIQGEKENPRILYFDTEQAREDVYLASQIIRNLMNRTKLPENLEIYPMRNFTIEQKKKTIEAYLENTKDVDLLVIDGIRDIMLNINDSEEAIKTATWLLNTSAKYNIHIIVVLHENKTDGNARGHIGTEIENKGEYMIVVERDSKNPSVRWVKPNRCRRAEFDPYAFTINNSGEPELKHDISLMSARDKKEYEEVSEWNYIIQDGINTKQEIINWFRKNKGIGQQAARNRFNKAIANNWIIERNGVCCLFTHSDSEEEELPF